MGVQNAHGQVEVLFQVVRKGFEFRSRGSGRVHVVQQEHTRDTQFTDLKDQEQLTLQGVRVGHKQDHIWMVLVLRVEEDALGDAAIVGLGVEVVQPRQVVQQP